jgi:hypothetical protein
MFWPLEGRKVGFYLEPIGQRRLLDLHKQGEVLDDNLYPTPGKFCGDGAGTTWLVGFPPL